MIPAIWSESLLRKISEFIQIRYIQETGIVCLQSIYVHSDNSTGERMSLIEPIMTR